MDNDLKTLKNLRATENILRLVAAGEVSEAALPRDKTKLPYNQERYTHSCGSPSCAFGWYMYAVGHVGLLQPPFPGSRVQQEFPALTEDEMHELFSGSGCGDAGNDALAAADYIAGFIARRFSGAGLEGAPSNEH